MKKYLDLGLSLLHYRLKSGKTITETAKEIGIDRTHLSKLEHGFERPSAQTLLNIISHYSLSAVETARLWALAGFAEGQGLVTIQKGEEVINTEYTSIEEEHLPEIEDDVETMQPSNQPILYCDAVNIRVNKFGLVFDFGQIGYMVGPSFNKANIVARVGMSESHAKRLLQVLKKQVSEKEEKDQ